MSALCLLVVVIFGEINLALQLLGLVELLVNYVLSQRYLGRVRRIVACQFNERATLPLGWRVVSF